jgi:hypothetical protein
MSHCRQACREIPSGNENRGAPTLPGKRRHEAPLRAQSRLPARRHRIGLRSHPRPGDPPYGSQSPKDSAAARSLSRALKTISASATGSRCSTTSSLPISTKSSYETA